MSSKDCKVCGELSLSFLTCPLDSIMRKERKEPCVFPRPLDSFERE